MQVGPQATDMVFQEQRERYKEKQLANQAFRRLSKDDNKELACQLSAVISATTAEPCSDESDIGNAGSLPSSLGFWKFMHVEHA